MMKKVSIVIPAYNKAEWTVRAVESVLGQTYPDIEIIVVDDGSMDDTPGRLSRFGNKIRYVPKANGGACSARNLGIRLATGEYIGFLDCDDMYLPQKVERSVDCLERNPRFGFVHTPVYYIDDNDTVLRACRLYRRRRQGWIAKDLVRGNFICNSTPLVRKICFEKSGLFDESIFIPADWDMWLRLAEQYETGYIGTPLTLYRISNNYIVNHLEQSIAEESMVVEKAVSRNPRPYLHIKDKLLSNVHYRHAICYLSVNDTDRSRKEIEQSMRKYRLNPKTMFLFIATAVLGNRMKSLRQCWSRLKII